jgi:hypothetical protein
LRIPLNALPVHAKGVKPPAGPGGIAIEFARQPVARCTGKRKKRKTGRPLWAARNAKIEERFDISLVWDVPNLSARGAL